MHFMLQIGTKAACTKACGAFYFSLDEVPAHWSDPTWPFASVCVWQNRNEMDTPDD